MNRKYFVTGIGTGIGKTIASAILTEHLNADYWKPIQSGDLDQSDSLKTESLILNIHTKIHPESYRLTQPFSPHASARLDGIEINLEQIKLPQTDRPLIIEGAGGLMVPLNDRQVLLDLIKRLDLPVIVISQNYLGSINHTLLTIDVLKQHQVKIEGILFNGPANEESECFILNYTNVRCLGKIPQFGQVNKETIAAAGKYLSL